MPAIKILNVVMMDLKIQIQVLWYLIDSVAFLRLLSKIDLNELRNKLYRPFGS